MFDPVDPKQRLPDLETGILQYWREEDTFKRSISQRRRRSDDILDNPGEKSEIRSSKSESDFEFQSSNFSFYDGPPFATGLPHYGHLLAGTIKDVIPRYQTMRGKAVERRFGWDCHGLPVENLIEKEHDIKDHQQIEDMGIGVFNDLCRNSVQRYSKEWREVVERMGRWVDMDWDYRTMDPDYMESIWWVFKQLADKELIFEGYKGMYICPRCATALSNFEVTLGYRDREDMSVVMTFPLVDDPKTVLLAWTTTPWSLPGNSWLAVGEHIKYAKVQEKGSDLTYILAERLVESVFKNKEYEIVGSVDPKALVNKKYEPLFPYFVDRVIPTTEREGKPATYGDRVFNVVMYDEVEVTDTEGTGIVHITSCLGEDSYAVAVREKLPDLAFHLGIDGNFYDFVEDFAGLNAKPEGDDPMATDKAIIQNLKDRGRYFSHYTYNHSYAHCWRCDTPLLPYTTNSWFVNIDTIKDKMLSSNSQTEWVPAHIRDGRFGKWLANARDWAISRNRYWGTPLPIWRTDDGDDLTVIGSRQDVMDHNKVRFTKVTTLRHAESEGNLIPIYQGLEPGTDLTKHGRKQAAQAGAWLQDQNVDIIYCSPLARTQQTAEIIAKATGAEVVVDDRLREVDFGEYEGKNIDFSDLTFIKERRKHKLEKNKPESIYHFDGMESWESVQERLESFMTEMLPHHRSQHVVIVTHADLMMNLKHFFTNEDTVKLSHQPYPEKAVPHVYYWDHAKQQQLDLHKDTVDDISWFGSPTEASVQVTVCRHGETDWNKEKKIQGGQNDIPLNDTGRQQARELAKELKDKEFDVVVTSHLKRARETGEILADELGIPIDEPLEVLNERNVGNWGGKTLAEVNAMQPAPIETQNAVIRNCTPDGGESIDEYISRMHQGIDVLLEQYAGKKVLLAVHRGVMQFLKLIAENRTYAEALAYVPDNAACDTFTINPRVKRIPEVLDCWFESGSMPYAQQHFPFEMAHSGLAEPADFPADFIAEGVDQTRGWFYTLMVLGAALFDKSPFEHCIVNGIVLAEDGKKMSKRLQNYPDPMEVVDRHGADAIRFTLMSSPAVRAEDLRFSEKLVEDTVRNVLLPLWNTYALFVTYANACDFAPTQTRRASKHPLDQWILAEVQDLANRMTKELDEYDLSATCNELHDTIDALTNWYVRLSRRRFAGKGILDAYPDASGDSEADDRAAALATLYDVLLTMSQLLAPFCPFITEAIYLNLVAEDHNSVHFTDWPEPRKLKKTEQVLLEKTRLLRLIVSLGNSIRGAKQIKNRQPLHSATVALPPALTIALDENDYALLRQELNVKVVDLTDDPEALAESYVQVDARQVGPRLGGQVQEVIQAGKAGDYQINNDGTITIGEHTLTTDEAQVVYRGKEGQDVAADKGVVVSVDTDVTDELRLEGDARDIIRGVQRLRKEAGYEFTDQITLQIDDANDVLEAFADLITSETRSTLGEVSADDQTIEVGERKVTIRFTKQ